MVKAYWACKDINNFGDLLTSYLLENMFGVRAVHSKTGPHLFVCGSILAEANTDTIVLGAGLGHESQRPESFMEGFFVRGPLTEKISGIKAIADPAIILPTIYGGTRTPTYRYGVIPHYIDSHATVPDGMLHIDITSGVENVIDGILQCDEVITSTLHGLIVAHAYGVPAVWVEFSDNVAGRGFKFRDYLLSVDITPYKPLDLREGIPAEVSVPLDLGRGYKLVDSVVKEMELGYSYYTGLG